MLVLPTEVSRTGKGKQLALLSLPEMLTAFTVLVYWVGNKRCFVIQIDLLLSCPWL